MTENDKEILMQAFEKLGKEEKAYIKEDDFTDKGMVGSWNKLVKTITEERRITGTEINNILQYITHMDMIRDIVLGMESQDKAINSIANNSKEMSVNIINAAELASTVSENSNKASSLSDQGYKTINKAFSFVDNSFNAIDNVNEQMDKVLQGTKQISEIVNIIKRIAKQTNLLALNAGIESARAGEHGKGFGVVANEVTKLADSTRESAMQIEQFIGSLKEQVESSVSNMQNTAEQLKTGKELVDGALDSISQINQSVNNISNEVMQIAASNQEQAATSEEISSETDEMTRTTSELSTKTNQTALSIFELSTKINGLRGMVTKNMAIFKRNQVFDIYIVDHLMWRWRIYNMLLGLEKVDPSNVGTHTSCRLGNWYYNFVTARTKADPVFALIEKPHIEFHKAVQDTVQAYAKKDMIAASKHFAEVDRCSREVVDLLTRLKD